MRTVVVLGPTASGKSRLALALAERFKGEIVSADALQAYRGLDIGTAKPTPAERSRVRHHLIDVLDPEQSYSAGEFARRARCAIADIIELGHRPIVAGGSGLYLRALLHGLADIPAANPEMRHDLRQRLDSEGLPVLRRELEARDPVTAAKLSAGDSQRTLRALEVVLGTGVPLSEWLTTRRPVGGGLAVVKVGLTLPRRLLYDRVAVRVRQMAKDGWVDEVAGLLQNGVDASAVAFQAIGYRDIVRYLEGQCSLEQALSDVVRATRRYAKRQLTWFRRESDVCWFPAQDANCLTSKVVEFLGGVGIEGRS